MWGFLEQADAARRAASNIRRHLDDLDASELAAAQKLSEKLDARAAELEYRWLALSVHTAGAARLVRWSWRVSRRGG